MQRRYSPKSSLRLLMKKPYRSLVAGSFLVCLLIVATLSFLIQQAWEAENRRAESIATNVSQIMVSQTHGVFRAVDFMLLNFTNHFDKRDRTPTDGEYNAELASLSLAFPEITTLKVVDAHGNTVSSSDGKTAGTFYGDRDYFARHRENRDSGLIISKPLRGKTNGEWVIVLSRGLRDSHDSFTGVVLASIPLQFFEQLYSKLDLGLAGNVSIFTYEDYTLMFRYPVLEKLIGQSFANSELYKTIRESGKTSGLARLRSVLDGQWRLHSFRVVPDMKFIIVIGLAERDYLADWYRRTLTIASLTGLTLLLLLVLFIRYLWAQEELEESRFQLVRSAKMSALGEMASGVAHEINNPLAIINGHSSILRSLIQSETKDADQKRERLDKIERTTMRIAKIVSGLKNFSRSGEEDPLLPTSVIQIIDDTMELCLTRLQNNGIEIRATKVGAGDLWIDCRAVQISQVLLNVISNSSDAIRSLPQKWIEIAVERTGSKLTIAITDSGSGISREVAEKIMQPFFTTKEVGQGTGLGLSISKGIVESHGGVLQYDDQSRHTRFSITLPACAKPPSKVQAAS